MLKFLFGKASMKRQSSTKQQATDKSEAAREIERKPHYTSKVKGRKLKQLSHLANAVVAYSAKVLSTTADELQAEFDETFTLSAKEDAEKYGRGFIEYCCFKALTVLTTTEDYLYDNDFRRYTFDCMVAWEAPSAHHGGIKDENENYEPLAKEEEDDDDASLFYSNLMPLLVDVENTVGLDAFVRIAPCITVVADIVSVHPRFETLTTSTSGRLPFPLYDKYIAALGKPCIKETKMKNSYPFLKDLPMSKEECVIEIDGISQTVIHHIGSKSSSGRLTLTDHALYFEPSSVLSYRDPIRLNLSADLGHEVFPDLSGPWGSRIFDKAITYRTSSLPEPMVFEFPELTGSTRRDYWLALIHEVIDVHKFIRERRLNALCQTEALAMAVLGIIRLQGTRDCIQMLPPSPRALLTFNLAEDFLGKGDLVLEALANTLKEATIDACDEDIARTSDKEDGSIAIPKSAAEVLHSFGIWKCDVPVAVYRTKPCQLTSLEVAIRESRESSKQVQRAKAKEEDVKLDGIGTNVAIMNELLRPVVALILWIRDIVSWNRPLETIHTHLILSYIIYREWLGYVFPALSIVACLFIIWLRVSDKKTKYREILVPNPSGGLSLEQAVTVQRAMSQIQGVLQATNIILLKLWALAVSVKPEITDLILGVLFASALVLALVPFKYIALAVLTGLFFKGFRNKTRESKLERRVRELWHSIPPIPVRIVSSEGDKKMQEALQA